MFAVSIRVLSATARSSKEISHEALVLLGSKDKQWDVLDKVTVRNQQNGLVSFELTESFDRLGAECSMKCSLIQN